jgi:peptidoglycan DL-endopeptidase CwlO
VSPKRLMRSVQSALAVTVVVAVVGVASTSALAEPTPPSNQSDAVKQLSDLSRQAEQLTEAYKKAQDDEDAKKADLNRANADAARAEQAVKQALADEEQYRGQVDQLTHASYEGARLSKLSALLTSTNPEDFLDRASALDALAKDNDDVIKRFQAAVDQAQTAQQQTQDARARAAQAEADANRLLGDIAAKQAAMNAQITKVKAQFNSLSGADKAALAGGNTRVGLLGGSGAAIAAVNAALSKQGVPYVWGATGPNSFDCSGLTQWAYKQAGVSIPRSTYSQVTIGTSVSEANLKPGDLMFFYSDYSHEGMYIGNGNMVHAPQSGEDVKVMPYKYMGEKPSAIRRVVG